MNEYSEVAKNAGGSGIRLPQFNAQRRNRELGASSEESKSVVVHPLTPTSPPRPQLEVPRGWKSSHATPESAREARPRVAAYSGRGPSHLGAPGGEAGSVARASACIQSLRPLAGVLRAQEH